MKLNKKQLKKNLYELEKEFPNEILPAEKLPLIGREHYFAEIPLENLTVENLCFLIVQGLGLKFLLPLAINHLSENPFVSGDRYDGDLLGAVLQIKKQFWQGNLDLYQKVESILQDAEAVEGGEAEEAITTFLPQTIYNFRKNKPKFENE